MELLYGTDQGCASESTIRETMRNVITETAKAGPDLKAAWGSQVISSPPPVTGLAHFFVDV